MKLSLAHCGLTGKGVAQIGQALAQNTFMASSLLHLDLSSNVAKDDINVIIFSFFFFFIMINWFLIYVIGGVQFSGAAQRTDVPESIQFGNSFRTCNYHYYILIQRKFFSIFQF